MRNKAEGIILALYSSGCIQYIYILDRQTLNQKFYPSPLTLVARFQLILGVAVDLSRCQWGVLSDFKFTSRCFLAVNMQLCQAAGSQLLTQTDWPKNKTPTHWNTPPNKVILISPAFNKYKGCKMLYLFDKENNNSNHVITRMSPQWYHIKRTTNEAKTILGTLFIKERFCPCHTH